MATSLDKYKLTETKKQEELNSLDKYKIKASVPEKKKNIFENVGGFIKDVAIESTKPVVQSLLSPYQALQTAKSISSAPTSEQLSTQSAKTTDLIKKLRDFESKGVKSGAEYTNVVNQLKAYSSQPSEISKAPSTKVKTAAWGDIETPKTASEVLGTGAKTLSLAGSPVVGGALWTGGEALQQGWAYVVGPMLGAFLAVIFYRFLKFTDADTTKP
jgi:hypothetical protein